jgi:hypothetical protein
MNQFTIGRQRAPSEPSCPACGGDAVVTGRCFGSPGAGTGFGFRPDPRPAVVAVHGPFNACADCGHFWTTISRARLDRALACGDRDRVAGDRLQRQ